MQPAEERNRPDRRERDAVLPPILSQPVKLILGRHVTVDDAAQCAAAMNEQLLKLGADRTVLVLCENSLGAALETIPRAGTGDQTDIGLHFANRLKRESKGPAAAMLRSWEDGIVAWPPHPLLVEFLKHIFSTHMRERENPIHVNPTIRYKRADFSGVLLDEIAMARRAFPKLYFCKEQPIVESYIHNEIRHSVCLDHQRMHILRGEADRALNAYRESVRSTLLQFKYRDERVAKQASDFMGTDRMRAVIIIRGILHAGMITQAFAQRNISVDPVLFSNVSNHQSFVLPENLFLNPENSRFAEANDLFAANLLTTYLVAHFSKSSAETTEWQQERDKIYLTVMSCGTNTGLEWLNAVIKGQAFRSEREVLAATVKWSQGRIPLEFQ
jgi:hypothetical protein